MAKRERESSLSDAASPLPSEPQASWTQDVAHTPKYIELDEAEYPPGKAMHCLLPPHKPLSFPQYLDYEAHYMKSHTNRCLECHKNLPSPHFLELHLSENHDPIVAARRDRSEKTFACFVEDCEKVCLDWKKRRSHLVDKHGFPKNYDFFIVNNGVDGRQSMLRPGIDAQGHRRSSRDRRDSSATASTQLTETTETSRRTDDTTLEESLPGEERSAAAINPSAMKEDHSVDSLTKSMSSLHFVPRSVTFGKRKGKAGFAKS